MTEQLKNEVSRNERRRRAGALGMACAAALLTVQPMLLIPAAALADDGTGNGNGGYSTNVNAAQGKIAAGTQVKVRLLDPISSSTAQVGDRFRVAVAGDDSSGLPSGTIFYGQVSHVRPATPNSAGSVTLQLALPRGGYAVDQYDNGNNSNGGGGYNSENAPSAGSNGSGGGDYNGQNNSNGPGNNGPDANASGPGGPGPNYNSNDNNNGGPNGSYSNNPNYGGPNTPPNAVTVSNDASATFAGRTPKSAGHTAGIAAGVGALLGFSRKRKLGDAIEGGALGGVGGVAVDQSMKRGASDVSFKRGDEITVHLNRPMAVRTIVVPADEG